MSAAPHLQLVDEIPSDGPQTMAQALAEIAHLEDVIAGLESAARSNAAKLSRATRDRETWARTHEHWVAIEELFKEWRIATGHTRSQFTVDRFEVALPFYANRKYGPEMIRRGVKGIAYDHFSKPMKNGRMERYDDWHLLFKSAGNFERFVNRAPLEENK
jgi:hypothetical protein